jgi:hypothetical protein
VRLDGRLEAVDPPARLDAADGREHRVLVADGAHLLVADHEPAEVVAERLDRRLADARDRGADGAKAADEARLVRGEPGLDEDDVHARATLAFASMAPVVLLGPQRTRPILARAVADARATGPIAAVTAGWEEREDEIDELSEHLRRPVHNLHLFRRGEEVFRRDPELFLAFGDHMARRERLRAAYRLRLAHALDAVAGVRRLAADPEVVEEETASAIEAVRALDAHHLERTAALEKELEEGTGLAEREEVAKQREAVAKIVDGCGAIAIAGGHVEVLLDRLRLFGVASLVGPRALFAWSGGAMVVSERVVLFHDRPPQGAGRAEVLGAGLALARGVLPLPHARRRLDLDDRERVSSLARRFAPARCLALDEECALSIDAKGRVRVDRARELLVSGEVVAAGPEAGTA